MKEKAPNMVPENYLDQDEFYSFIFEEKQRYKDKSFLHSKYHEFYRRLLDNKLDQQEMEELKKNAPDVLCCLQERNELYQQKYIPKP